MFAEGLITNFTAILGLEWTKESALKRTEAYDEARSSIDELFTACREIAKTLSLKRAKTTVIDTMSKLMKQVPEFIKDWQESSARGVASLVLATCKAHFPSMNFADVARDTPKGANMRSILAETQGFDQLFVRRVNHSFWYHKYDLPKGFSDAEDEGEGDQEYYAEGSGSSAELSEEGSDEDSDIGSGDGSGDGSAYVASEEDHSSE
jgi:gas vesicle protein